MCVAMPRWRWCDTRCCWHGARCVTLVPDLALNNFVASNRSYAALERIAAGGADRRRRAHPRGVDAALSVTDQVRSRLGLGALLLSAAA